MFVLLFSTSKTEMRINLEINFLESFISFGLFILFFTSTFSESSIRIGRNANEILELTKRSL